MASESACISFQVAQECLNTVLRKAEIALDECPARAYFDTVLMPLHRVPSSTALYRRGLALQSQWKLGCYDPLIITAALKAGCKRLLSGDLQHGQRIETLRIETPFRE